MTDKTGKLGPEKLARMIDISAVQAFHGKKEIDELIEYAIEYNFRITSYNVCYTKLLRLLWT